MILSLGGDGVGGSKKFEGNDERDPLCQAYGHVQRVIGMCMRALETPGLDEENRRKWIMVLTQQINTLIRLKKAMGEEPEEDETLIDLVNKVPLHVTKAVERETGLRFRRRDG